MRPRVAQVATVNMRLPLSIERDKPDVDNELVEQIVTETRARVASRTQEGRGRRRSILF
jgi:hypothetical protein